MFDFLKKKNKTKNIDMKEVDKKLDKLVSTEVVLDSPWEWIEYIKKDLDTYKKFIIHDIEYIYKDVKVKSLNFKIKKDIGNYIFIFVNCEYLNGPKVEIIRKFIIDKLKIIIDAYSGKTLYDNYKIGLFKIDVKRLYLDELILKTGEKYLPCTNDCKNLPYDMLTIKKRCVKMGNKNYPIYDLVIEELDDVEYINKPEESI